MPRKRITGRARKVTPESQLRLQVQKTNVKIRRLEKSGNFGSWGTKQLLHYIGDKDVPIKLTGRKGRRQLKVLKSIKDLKPRDVKEVTKKITSLSNQKTFSKIGQKQVEREIRTKVEKTLGRRIEGKADFEKFIKIVEYMKNSKLQAINPSDAYIIVENAEKNELDEDEFLNILKNYQTINLDETKKAAKELFEKFVLS